MLVFGAYATHAAVVGLPNAEKVEAPAKKTEVAVIPDRIMGKVDAPITVEEYVSLTCSHCADFYNKVLPELEKKYLETGKVRFILRDYPLDGVALKASQLARCMPPEQFYPFVKVLYKNLEGWALSKEPEKALMQYAMLGGLSSEKATACLEDKALQEALINQRMAAMNSPGIQSTPTFVINGSEIIKGTQPVETYTKLFDKLLAEKH